MSIHIGDVNQKEIEQLFFDQIKKGMQATSLMAYEKIKDKLGGKHLKVVEVLEQIPAGSNMEIAACLGWSINRVTPRVKELRDLRVIEHAGERTCLITGSRVNIWRIKKNE